MAIRSNHYDAAFEDYLRAHRQPYIAVDEQRRALLQHASLKSMDFIVHRADGQPHLLVDVKGRRFPSRRDTSASRWENWATADDVRSLLEWERVFGASFQAAFVFAYWLPAGDDEVRQHHAAIFPFRGQSYAFYLVEVGEYRSRMTDRSASWGTVNLPRGAFRELCRPVDDFLAPAPLPLEEESLPL